MPSQSDEDYSHILLFTQFNLHAHKFHLRDKNPTKILKNNYCISLRYVGHCVNIYWLG